MRHNIDCVAIDIERQKHQSLFVRGRLAVEASFIQDSTELVAFLHGLQSSQRVINDSVHSMMLRSSFNCRVSESARDGWLEIDYVTPLYVLWTANIPGTVKES